MTYDVLERVSSTSILCERSVEVVDDSSMGISNNVLEDRAIANGLEDGGLLLLFEVDALGIAAALNVRNALIVPDVLIVADE